MTKLTSMMRTTMAAALALAVLALAPAHGRGQGEAGATGSLLVCGGPQVLRLTVRLAGEKAELVSRTDWEADKSQGMPAAMVPAFRTTDDCKPIDDGARILITSSAGGVAIVERESGETRFHATVPNAHSADLLPRNRVVVAASTAPTGNRLVVFDRAASATEVYSTPLVSAHGTVWIEAEQTLWALGLTELRAYDLVDWDSAKPSLKLRQTFSLPSRGGHDLSPIPRSSSFVVTTGRQVLTFDRKTGQFTPYPELGTLVDVKSVSIHPATGRVVFIQADRPEWWSRTIRLLGPAASLGFPNDRLYKARWVP